MRELNFGDRTDLAPVLSRENIEQLGALGKSVHWSGHDLLYRQGETATFVHVLTRGRVKSCAVGASGNEMIFRLHLPGSLLGLTALAPRRLRDASAVAIEPCQTIAVHRDQLKETLGGDGALAVSLISLLLDRLRHFQSRICQQLEAPLEERLACALLELTRENAGADNAVVALTHEDLSHIVGARRPSVSKCLRSFASHGLIETGHRAISIINSEGLQALAGDPVRAPVQTM